MVKSRLNVMRYVKMNKYAVHPPQLRTNIIVRHKYRYVSNSGTSTLVDRQNIATAAGVLATSAVLGKTIFQSLRVVEIEMWTPPASQGAAATCSVLWTGNSGFYASAVEVSDTSVSTAEPAHIRAKPPKNSESSFWGNAGTSDGLFSLVAPPGTIIDLTVELVLADGNATGLNATLVGATIGAIYYCSLDSSTSAGSRYLPVSLVSL
jgi:hypothetical protein